ncbi:MAG TPA: DNA-binding domain-containing protein [Steroidobacteraceae bacterium]|nr:DNA-binding domain-containing protein [Steroidobacteraceae bacterium]
MRLADLERAVQAHVLSGGALPDSLAAAVEPPAAERWQIYTEAYRLRLAEALAIHYPALHAWLGADAFDARVQAFIAATPSVHRSIRDYGSELSAFLRERAEGIEDEMLAELAAFEWALAAAFDAANAAPTVAADIASIAPADWPELRFRAVPSARRQRTLTNAVAVWRAVRPRDATEPTQAPQSIAQPVAAGATDPVEWLIWRRLLTTEFRSLEVAEARALDQLLGGATFGDLCGSLAEPYGDGAALKAAGWLKGWLLEGLLVRV